MRLQPWILAICLTLGVVGSAQASPLPLSSADWTRVDRGEIVVTVGPQRGDFQLYQAAGTLQATQPQVYRMLIDFTNHTKIFSKVAKSVIKKKVAADHFHIYKDLNLPWPMTGKWNLSDTTLRPNQYGYSWKSIDGNVGKQYGSYETLARNGKALLVYQIWYDVAHSGMPKMVFTKAQQIALPGLIEDCRKSVSRY